MQLFSYEELVAEIARVRDLINNSHNYHTIKQNKKYLKKLLKDYYAYKHYKGV